MNADLDLTSDDDRSTTPVTPAQAKQYEQHVADLVAKMPNSTVEHNVKLLGKSGRPRQVDVLVTGDVAGKQIRIAIECKRYSRKVGIGTIDEFFGKLHDLGIGHGVFYSFGPVDAGAQARADSAANPEIEVREWSPLVPAFAPWTDALEEFGGFGDCANPNCFTGDIRWTQWPQADGSSPILAGPCDMCGTWAYRCSECEAVNEVDGVNVECFCGATYEVESHYQGGEFEGIAQTSGSTG